MTSFHRAASLVALGLLCAACSKPPPPAPHPVDVATVTVHPQATSFPEDFVAETEAIIAVRLYREDATARVARIHCAAPLGAAPRSATLVATSPDSEAGRT